MNSTEGNDNDNNANKNLRELVRTVSFAAHKHQNQRRKNNLNTPYINHPIEVARILSDNGVSDLITLQGALLHDTVEDTNTTLVEIGENFGEDVAKLVAEVSDDKTLPKQRRKELQVENASHKSDRAKLILLADKIHNLHTFFADAIPTGWAQERIDEYFVWSKRVVDSGYRGINADLDHLFDHYANMPPPKHNRQT